MQSELDLAGRHLGGYEVVERLEAGGMATLYLGRKHGASGFTRKVAIKIMHPHLAIDERIVRMFVDEARICSQMTHPNLVRVEELGVDRGLYYLAMEYIDGCSLRAVFKYLSRMDRTLSVPLATRTPRTRPWVRTAVRSMSSIATSVRRTSCCRARGT